MEEKQIKTQPEMNYIEMTHLCNDCGNMTACKDGVCKISRPTQNTKEETA